MLVSVATFWFLIYVQIVLKTELCQCVERDDEYDDVLEGTNADDDARAAATTAEMKMILYWLRMLGLLVLVMIMIVLVLGLLMAPL